MNLVTIGCVIKLDPNFDRESINWYMVCFTVSF